MGAGVPRPCSAKRANESTIPGTPARIIIAPMPRVSSRPRNGGRSCQPVIDHGTSPASVHGATTKKTAEPRTAMVRCTAVPDTRCELIPTSPSWTISSMADERPRALLGLEHSSNFEFAISPNDRIRVDRQIHRQLAYGGKLIATLQGAGRHAANHLVHDLAVDRNAAPQVQPELERLSFVFCYNHLEV